MPEETRIDTCINVYVVQNFELLRLASWVSDWCYVSHVCRHSLMMVMMMFMMMVMMMVMVTLYIEAVITLLLFTIG